MATKALKMTVEGAPGSEANVFLSKGQRPQTCKVHATAETILKLRLYTQWAGTGAQPTNDEGLLVGCAPVPVKALDRPVWVRLTKDQGREDLSKLGPEDLIAIFRSPGPDGSVAVHGLRRVTVGLIAAACAGNGSALHAQRPRAGGPAEEDRERE